MSSTTVALPQQQLRQRLKAERQIVIAEFRENSKPEKLLRGLRHSVDGVLTDEVGGGVSQFATTLFNAAFFAGVPILEHKPHSFYISRYPAGRESTVYFGAIDVRFRNDTRHPMLVRTRSTAGSASTRAWSTSPAPMRRRSATTSR